METSTVIDWTREALKLALLLGGPMLAVALIVGILVGMAQTATQMHEPVVAQVPRMIAIAIAALVLLPFLIGRWVSFTTNLFHSLPDRF